MTAKATVMAKPEEAGPKSGPHLAMFPVGATHFAQAKSKPRTISDNTEVWSVFYLPSLSEHAEV